MIINSAIICFGSNIKPEINIPKARTLIEMRFTIVRYSRFIITPPIDRPEQPDYTNGCVLITTELSFDHLSEHLKEIEHTLGRIRTSDKFAPRTIDLDIVIWNGAVCDKDFHTRDFLRDLVLELIPDLKF